MLFRKLLHKTGCEVAACRALLCIIAVMLAAHCSAQKSGGTLIDSLRRQLPLVRADTARISLMNRIAGIYCAISPDTAAIYADSTLMMAKAAGWDAGVAKAYTTLGTSAIYRADFKGAELFWNKALKLYEAADDRQGMLRIIGNLGIVYNSQGAYSRSLQNNFLALKYAEELNDRRSIAINYGNIGSTYEYLKAPSKALTYDLKALSIFEELGDAQSAAVFMGNIGNAYGEQQKYTEALQYLRLALAQHRRLENREGVARLLGNIGAVYVALRKWDSGLSYYDKSLAASKAGDFRILESNALISIGQVALTFSKDSGTTDASKLTPFGMPASKRMMAGYAIECFRKSIAIDSSLGNLDELQHNYNSLAEAQEAIGDYRGALASHKAYMRFKDSVFSTESRLKIANLETQRELELKDKQIIIDRLAVAKKRNERVLFMAGIGALLLAGGFLFRNVRLKGAKSLSEYKLQALQAQMNPHFIFNSLNSIQRIILQSDKMLAATYLADFSKLMRRILDNSHEQFVSLDAIVETLRMYVHLEEMRFNNEFSYEFRLDDDLPLEELKLPPMLLQPYVENAIIHGLMPKDGPKMLLIQLTEQHDALHCIIEDNGVGRAAPKVRNGHISRGEALTKGMRESLNSLLNIKATISYADLKDATGAASGTRVEIIIPLKVH